MARAGVSLSLEQDRWLLHLPARPGGGGGGGTSAPSVKPLRQKPPVPADGIEITELDLPENGNGAVLPGVDSHGNLIPWFGDGGAAAPAAEEQHSALGSAGPGAAEVGPAAGGAGAGAGASASAAAAAHRSAAQSDDTRQSQAAALDATRVAVAAQAAAAVEAAIADALAAPPRKRLRQAMEDGGSGSHDRSVSPSAAGAAAAGGFAVGSVPGAAAVSDQTTLSAGGGGGTPLLEAAVEAGGLSGSGAGGGSLFADGEDDEEEGEEATQAEKFDTQCALCDDGGSLLACDGPCMRSFHTDAGEGKCNVLGLPADMCKLLSTSCSETFLCPNCLAGVHQCFKCKEEGRAGSEVLKCINASCGRHYHPECGGFAPGEPFVCPLHKCRACGQHGDAAAADKQGELVPCRRCPKAYHRRCLPDRLPRYRLGGAGPRVWLADYDEEQGGWLDGVEQSLMYCLKHRLGDNGQALFELPSLNRFGKKQQRASYPLVRPDLRRAALLHYAEQYRHLASSRRLLAEENERQERIRLTRAASVEAASGSEGEEDQPLAARAAARRHLRKAAEAAAAAAPARTGFKQQPPLKIRKLKGDSQAAGPAGGKASAAHRVAAAAAAASGDSDALSDVTEDAAGAEALSEATQDAAGAPEARAGGGGGEEVLQRSPAARARVNELAAALEHLLQVPGRRSRQDRLRRLLQEAENEPRLTKDSVWHATRRPEPYRHPMKKTIDEAKLQAMESSVQYAVSRQLSNAELMQLLDASACRSLLAHYDDLTMVLAPYLHGDRYSSYGRHFTSPSLLHKTADRLAMFLRSGDQIVDFSCGENYFVPYLKKLCLRQGIALRGRSYDIILAKDNTDFVLKSWLDTHPDDRDGRERFAPPAQLCMCLNPPFGKNNILADRFVAQAAHFKPRLIALIVPPSVHIPKGYQVVYENSKLCRGEEFYVPGCTHRSWNKVPPVLRIMMRLECQPELAHMGDPGAFEVLYDCTAEARGVPQQQQYNQQPHLQMNHGGGAVQQQARLWR
ncbi:Protein ENHANCED DOWNY MILDEW 2 [Chlorella vulgaris]